MIEILDTLSKSFISIALLSERWLTMDAVAVVTPYRNEVLVTIIFPHLSAQFDAPPNFEKKYQTHLADAFHDRYLLPQHSPRLPMIRSNIINP